MQSPLQILWDAGDLSSLTRDDIDAKEHVTSRGEGGREKRIRGCIFKRGKGNRRSKQLYEACELASVAAAAFLPANSSG